MAVFTLNRMDGWNDGWDNTWQGSYPKTTPITSLLYNSLPTVGIVGMDAEGNGKHTCM